MVVCSISIISWTAEEVEVLFYPMLLDLQKSFPSGKNKVQMKTSVEHW